MKSGCLEIMVSEKLGCILCVEMVCSGEIQDLLLRVKSS